MLERKLSFDMLRHCNQLRIAIEPEAAALAAEYATDDDIAAISEALDASSPDSVHARVSEYS